LRSKLIAFLCTLSVSSLVYADDNFFLITKKKNALKVSTKEEIKEIFLGRNTYDPIDGRIGAAFFIESDSTLDHAIERATDVTPSRYNSIWRRKHFSGSGIPPVKIKSKDELREFVSAYSTYVIITDQSKLPQLDVMIKPMP